MGLHSDDAERAGACSEWILSLTMIEVNMRRGETHDIMIPTRTVHVISMAQDTYLNII